MLLVTMLLLCSSASLTCLPAACAAWPPGGYHDVLVRIEDVPLTVLSGYRSSGRPVDFSRMLPAQQQQQQQQAQGCWTLTLLLAADVMRARAACSLGGLVSLDKQLGRERAEGERCSGASAVSGRRRGGLLARVLHSKPATGETSPSREWWACRCWSNCI